MDHTVWEQEIWFYNGYLDQRNEYVSLSLRPCDIKEWPYTYSFLRSDGHYIYVQILNPCDLGHAIELTFQDGRWLWVSMWQRYLEKDRA